MTPRRRAALGLVGAAIVALLLGIGPGVMAATAVGALTIVDALLVRRVPHLRRELPTILPRGIPVPFSVTSAGTGRVELRQPAPADVRVDPATGSGRLTGTLVAHRRGLHELAPTAARSVGPLGLGAWHHAVGEPQHIAVYPDIVTARKLARAVATGRFHEQGRRRTQLRGLGTEFDSIRDYAPDDDIRQVNWRASLRMGRAMSNQYRVDRDRDVVCVVDIGRLMGAPLGQMTRLDAAVDAATAIVYTADELGDRAGLVAFDAAIRRNVRPRRRGGEAVVGSMFDLEPTRHESDYEAAFRVVGRAKRALVVVFTDLLEEAAAEPLVEAVPVLARTHTVLIATSADDDLLQAVTREPADAEDVYRAAVAVEVLEAKEQVVHRLRRAGAGVVDAGSGKLPAACIAAYLDAKKHARI
jgi:uncharacterized protein (DUF58 family)